MSLGLRRQLCLRRSGMRIGTDRQAEYRRGVLERATPMGEVIGPARIASEPQSEVDLELIETRFTAVIHRLDELVGAHQIPIFGEQRPLRSLEQIAGGAQLGRA